MRQLCSSRALAVAAIALGVAASSSSRARPVPTRAPARSPYCIATYANDQVAMLPATRQAEERARYTMCVRSVAVYQCAFYGPDGSLMSRRETKSAHGTAFAFRSEGAWTYLMTNEHVIEWPYVTTKETPVEGVPLGCKRLSQKVFVVDDENDVYSKDDRPLERVVVDPELDVAVLKAQIKVEAIPFALGQSAALKVGNAVRVRGFPLGAFQAVHSGRVVSAREPDRDGKWDHTDFVVDAQLSSGSSGSPILAVSCKTGKFELVGIYHAGYVHGQGLNVAVGIDEFREIMTTLRPRSKRKLVPVLGAVERRELVLQLRRGQVTRQFPFGGHTLELRVTGDERLLYDFFPKRHPLVDWRLAVIEDLPAPGYGRIGRIWLGNDQGLAERGFTELKPAEQTNVANTVEAIRRHVRVVIQYRAAEALAKKSRAGLERLQLIERELNRGQSARSAQMRALVDLSAAHGPSAGKGLPLAATVKPSTAPANGAPKPGQQGAASKPAVVSRQPR